MLERASWWSGLRGTTLQHRVGQVIRSDKLIYMLRYVFYLLSDGNKKTGSTVRDCSLEEIYPIKE